MHNKKIGFLLLIFTSTILPISSYYSIRSQGFNTARELAGWTNFIHQYNDGLYGTIAGTVEYTRSFNPFSIAQCLFGSDIRKDSCDCAPILTISGSQTINRNANDWLADYFGLPTNFKSTVCFNPLIQNVIIDLDGFVGFDACVQGLYLKLDVPITITKWSMDMCETVSSAGTNPYPAGYFSGSQESGTLHSFTEFITGAASPALNTQVAADPTFPASTFTPLSFGKICLNPMSQAGIAEIRLTVGWDWLQDTYHAGVYGILAIPTGTRPKGQFLFEPIVGNGAHTELGVGFCAHWDFWSCLDENSVACIYFDAHATHLFNARQRRTFDLKCKPNSRYMLAQKINENQLDPHLANPPFPAVEFQSLFTTVANISTLDVDVKAAVQGEITVLLDYTHDAWSFDLGYNFWGRSCEKISLPCHTFPAVACDATGAPLQINPNTWALKGDATVIGFEFDSPTPVRLAATESNATIHAGTNMPAAGSNNPLVINNARANPSIDNPLSAFTNSTTVHINSDSALATNLQVHSSNPPRYISTADLDLCGTKGISHKLFAHVAYTWLETCNNWTPYLGFGAEVEFGSRGCCAPTSSFNCSVSHCGEWLIGNGCCAPTSCCNCSVSQWGIWLKGGAAFN